MTTTDTYASRLLEKIIEFIDLPPSYYRKAAERYRSLDEWFRRDQSQIVDFNPQVYPQGSFRYGTVIRPILRSEEYDLDLVCELMLSKSVVSQKVVKELVGNEIKAYAAAYGFNKPASEKNRCWRLDYADDVSFHMDILPAIPEDPAFISRLARLGVLSDLAKTSVAITDRRHPKYSEVQPDWPCSNPRGFAAWFEGRMRKIAQSRISQLVMDRLYLSDDEVPSHEWKTPLQRSIQLLKRHRDVMFKDNSDLSPISMIITTLAAHAYEGEADLYQALSQILVRMPNFVRPSVPRIPNPVNPAEDFADRWRSDPRLEQNFWAWHAQAKADLENLPKFIVDGQLPKAIKKRFDADLTPNQINELTALAPKSSSSSVRRASSIKIGPSAPKPWQTD